jgi:hypothetical protein
MTRAHGPRTGRLRRLALWLGVLAAVAGFGGYLGTQPALASSGGGCAGRTGFPAGSLAACISASGSALRPDGYVTWNYIPAGCAVDLYLQDNTGTVIHLARYACGWTHYGPVNWTAPSGTTWYGKLAVVIGGNVYQSVSPAQYLSY